MMTPLRFLIGTLLLSLSGLAAGGKDAKQAKVNLDRFRMIPVLEGARIVPIDSYAHNQILGLRGRALPGEASVSWLARTLFDPESTDDDFLLVLDHPDIAADAEITAEANHRRYRYEDVAPAVPRLVQQAQDAETVDTELRSELEKETIRFTRAVLQFEGLRRTLLFARVPDAPLEDMFRVDDPGLAKQLGVETGTAFSYFRLFDNPALEGIGMELLQRASDPDTVLDTSDRAAMSLIGELQRFQEQFLGFRFPLETIPVDPHTGSQNWQSPPNSLTLARQMQSQDPELINAIGNWVAMSEAYRASDQLGFDKAVDEYLSFIARRTELSKELTGASTIWLKRAESLLRFDMMFLGVGTLFILLMAFGRRRGIQVGAVGLGLMFVATLLLLGVRLYSGTTMELTGIIFMWLSIAATIGVGVFYAFFNKQPFGRIMGRILIGVGVFFAVAIALIAFSANPETGEGWKVANSWLLPIESRFNRANWFKTALYIYVIAFFISFVAIVLRKPLVIKIALVVLGVAILFHVVGIEYRMFITKRPPVTNLYATFPFVALVCALLGLGIEAFYRNGIGVMCGSVVGWTLIMMSSMFADSDTMGEVVPVLSSQFWLSTHVITIMFGYAGVFLAGVVGHLWLILRISFGTMSKGGVLKKADKNFLKVTFRIMMSILAFGLVFSFLGTMLGGVWADQSWGRFWGWDPKENGAILIVNWCAIAYHCRIGNVLREVGLAAMAVGGCVVVMLAWLGINNLGVGLHSYGFESGLFTVLMLYILAELAFLMITMPIAWMMERGSRPNLNLPKPQAPVAS